MNVSTCCASFLFSHTPVETKDPRKTGKIPVTRFYRVTVKKEQKVVQEVNHVFNVYTRWKKSAGLVFFFGLFVLFFLFLDDLCLYFYPNAESCQKHCETFL